MEPIHNKREKHEKRFGTWIKIAMGGRKYFKEIPGNFGWKAKYVKEVDADEITLRF